MSSAATRPTALNKGLSSATKDTSKKLPHGKAKPAKIKEQRSQPEADASGSSTGTASALTGGKAAASVPGRLAKGVKRSVPAEKIQETVKSVQEKVDTAKEDVEPPDIGAQVKDTGAPADISDNLPLSLSALDGLEVGEGGKILDNEGRSIGEVIEGDPEDLVGQTVNSNGEILDEDGDLIGRVDVIRQVGEEAAKGIPAPEQAPEVAQQGLETLQGLEKLQGLPVTDEGDVKDETGRVVGRVVEGNPSDMIGAVPNDKGDILNDDGELIGRVELVPLETEAQPGEVAIEKPEEPEKLLDVSTLEGLTCNKAGSIVTADGRPVGELVEGDPKRICRESLQLDDQGQFWDNRGNVIGRARPIATEEEQPGPFADLGEIFVTEDSWVQDKNGNRVGKVVDGDPKKLIGYAVDDDGDILDKRGNVIGHAEPWEEPEVEVPQVDFSSVAGLKPNKQGIVIGPEQVPIARVVKGNLKEMTGRAIDGNGQIWNDSGEVIGQVELIPEDERESMGPFSGLGDLVVNMSGFVEDANGTVVGKLIEGDPQKLRGQAVDDDGEILDKYGNVKGRAERYEPPEEDLSILEGMTVNKLGNVVDRNGVLFGRVVAGTPKKLAGKKVDGEGQVWSDAGKVIGQVELIPESEREKPEGEFFGLDGLTLGKEGMVVDPAGQTVGRLVEGDPQRLVGRAVDEDGEIIDKFGNVIGRAERWTPEEPEEQPESEDIVLAKKMCSIVQQTLDSVGPLCRQITQNIEKANSTPKDELDEEQLVKDVKPLIEEAGNALQECKGALRALDPDGQIAATAKARSASHEATPAEYQLADLLKELTQTVAETIDRGRRLIADMPHAKKKINPLWALLSEPLVQIIAAVGLLLSGVLGLVGNLLNGLGLGGLLKGLLGGLGLDKLLEGFGIGTVTEALGLDGKK